MNKTDPAIERVTTPFSLTRQLALLIQERNTELISIQGRGEMMSRSYLESLSYGVLVETVHDIIVAVNDIVATMISDTMIDSSGGGISPLRIATWQIKEMGRQYEIAILRRIADDAMDILSTRQVSDG